MRRIIVLLAFAAMTAVLAGASAGATTVGANCVKPLDLLSSGQDLSYCNLKGATLSADYALYVSNVTGANLSGATISGYEALASSNVNGANLSKATISGAGALAATSMIGANLNGAKISGNTLNSADLTGANLNKAQISFPALHDAFYSNTTCPDGSNSDNDGGTCVGHGVPAS
jgi:uncharacterized protein YjbI with pentapeptide repeats